MSCDTLRSRSQYKTPSHEDGGQNLPEDLNHRVHLRHPGYSDTGNILMVLPALDHPQGGIHHETARIARAIVANNKWEGFLTETRAGGRTAVGSDGILRGKNYYFRVSENAGLASDEISKRIHALAPNEVRVFCNVSASLSTLIGSLFSASSPLLCQLECACLQLPALAPRA